MPAISFHRQNSLWRTRGFARTHARTHTSTFWYVEDNLDRRFVTSTTDRTTLVPQVCSKTRNKIVKADQLKRDRINYLNLRVKLRKVSHVSHPWLTNTDLENDDDHRDMVLTDLPQHSSRPPSTLSERTLNRQQAHPFKYIPVTHRHVVMTRAIRILDDNDDNQKSGARAQTSMWTWRCDCVIGSRGTQIEKLWQIKHI